MKTKILALLNPNSGPGNTLQDTILAIHEHWEDEENEIFIQLSRSKEDAHEKMDMAKELGIDLIICSGGDGTLNSLLPVLIKNKIPVAFIPTGSVNGFARNFNIPLEIPEAVKALKNGTITSIDVGTANDHHFVLSCSFAWEASVIKKFEDLPIRGIVSYLAAAGLTALKYTPQAHTVIRSDKSEHAYNQPMLMTLSNVSKYTDSTLDLISKKSKANDGLMELVVVEKEDFLALTASLGKLKDEGIENFDMVETLQDSEFVIKRPETADIQIDGEVITDQKDITIKVLKEALAIRIPQEQ